MIQEPSCSHVEQQRSITVRKFRAFCLMHAVNDKKAGSRHIFGFCATKTMQFLTATLLYLASHLSLHKLFQTNTKIFADYAKLEEKPTQLHLTDGKSQYVTFQTNYSICFSRPYYSLT
jgi:hypothetical protein